MASSNRHWPSMFRSKPRNADHQWPHDISSSLLPSGCHGTPYSSPGCEERTPEPKPRWNPKPEQIRILEAIFDSGMVNPPRDEIRKIRAQLQEYGQVGDANVFYWFQNRKSRSKHKLRHLRNSKQQKQNANNTSNSSGNSSATATVAASLPAHSNPFSSSLSQKSSSSTIAPQSSDTTSLSLDSVINQASYFPATVSATGVHGDQVLSEMPLPLAPLQGFCFSSALPIGTIDQPTVPEQAGVVNRPCSNLLLSELLGHEKVLEWEKAKTTSLLGYPSLVGGDSADEASLSAATPAASTAATAVALSLPVHHVHGVPVGLASNVPEGKSTVFINDVAFQVPSGPFNVHGAFGDGAVLINSDGEIVVADQWGITLQPLQHGAFYYLI